MAAILTSIQAKAARHATKLFQGKVATDLGINRAYLTLFESGKYLFNDSALSSLRNYYEEHGYEFNRDFEDMNGQLKSDPSPHNPFRVKDGFEIPSSMDESEVEELLAVVVAT